MEPLATLDYSAADINTRPDPVRVCLTFLAVALFTDAAFGVLCWLAVGRVVTTYLAIVVISNAMYVCASFFVFGILMAIRLRWRGTLRSNVYKVVVFGGVINALIIPLSAALDDYIVEESPAVTGIFVSAMALVTFALPLWLVRQQREVLEDQI